MAGLHRFDNFVAHLFRLPAVLLRVFVPFFVLISQLSRSPGLRPSRPSTELLIRPQLILLPGTYIPYHSAMQDAPKQFYVSFFNLPLVERVRQLKTNRIGRLVSVSGTVTRSTDVRPELLRGTFTCRKCGLVREGKRERKV